MKLNDAVFGAILAIVGAVVLVHVQSFPTIPGQQYGPGLFPGTVAAGFVVCGVLLVVSGVRNRATEPWFAAGEWMRSRPQLVAVVVVIGSVAAYILLAERVGFLIVAPLMLAACFLALRVRLRTAVVASLIATLVIWYAFYKLLRVPLPWGWLTPYAF